MAATLQYLSNGRLILGIGAGWQADEYRAYDYPFPSAGTRVEPEQDPSASFSNEIDWVMGPTPDDALRQLQPLVDLGVTQVTVYFHDRRSLDLFAREVVPVFRRP